MTHSFAMWVGLIIHLSGVVTSRGGGVLNKEIRHEHIQKRTGATCKKDQARAERTTSANQGRADTAHARE